MKSFSKWEGLLDHSYSGRCPALFTLLFFQRLWKCDHSSKHRYSQRDKQFIYLSILQQRKLQAQRNVSLLLYDRHVKRVLEGNMPKHIILLTDTCQLQNIFKGWVAPTEPNLMLQDREGTQIFTCRQDKTILDQTKRMTHLEEVFCIRKFLECLMTSEMCLIWGPKLIPTTEKLTKTFSFSLKLLLYADTHFYTTVVLLQY